MTAKVRIAIGAAGAAVVVAGVAGAMTATASAESTATVAPASARVPADGMGGGAGPSRIQIDDRVYAAAPGSCITLPAAPGGNAVTNGTGLSIAFFGNGTCAGVPVATVGPNGSAFGVAPPAGAGSFRVLNVN